VLFEGRHDKTFCLVAGRIERRLKDRVRTKLGLQPIADIKEMTLANFSRLHGIDPSFDLPTLSKIKKQAVGQLQLLMLPDQATPPAA
jgi:hypothetical protein